jgi:cell division protein ZapA
MAQVSLQINGFGYMLGCGDGEEAHVLALAADLETRIDEIKAATGPSGEARLLLMAALMLADELHDLRGQPDGGGKADPKAGRRLRGLAKRAEAIAAAAETPPLVAGMADAENVAAPPEEA